MNEPDNNVMNIPGKTELPWGVKGALLVFAVSFLSILVPTIFLTQLPIDASAQYFIAESIFPIPFFVFFYFWLKKKGIDKKAIGLCLPASNILLATLVAITIAALFKGLDFLLFFGSLSELNPNRLAIAAGPSFAVTYGLGRVIVTPLMEEVVHRGVIYGYLRSRLGWPAGLVLQALIFTLVHPNVYQGDLTMILFYFAFGLAFGTLYQFYRSLYPAFICHAALNYLDATIQIVF